MKRRFLIAALCLLPIAAQARSNGQNVALLNGIPPSWTVDFRAVAYSALTATRAGTVWDYGSAGTITSFATNVPAMPVFSQRVATTSLGLGVWTARTNRWANNSQSQTINITSGQSIVVWGDSASGTASIGCTGGLVGTATANGWPGQFIATSTNTTTTCTVTGTLTHGQLSNFASGAFAAPPIITTTTAVTTASDNDTIPTSAITGWTPARGTIVAEFMPTSAAVVSGTVFTISDGTNTNLVRMRVITGGTGIDATTSTASVASSLTGTTPVTFLVRNKAAMSWDGTTISLSVNGGAVQRVAQTAALPTTLTTMQLGGSGTNGNQFQGYIQRIQFYPQALATRLSGLSQ